MSLICIQRGVHGFIFLYACQLLVLQDVSANAANRCERWGVGFGATFLFDRVSHEEVPRTAWQTKSSLAKVMMGLVYTGNSKI